MNQINNPINQQPGNIYTLQQKASDAIYIVCGAISLPIEFVLRPHYGSQYVSPIQLALASLMMLMLPVIFDLSTYVPLPLFASHLTTPPLITLTKYFFIGAFLHCIRVWWRMLHMASEKNARFEGDPLPIFKLFPKSSFYMIRIIWEPLTVFLVASTLHKMGYIQHAAIYLEVAAFALMMKSFVAWHYVWNYMRDLMNLQHAAPIIARAVENNATGSEMASINLASFPKDAPPEMKRAAAIHIARTLYPNQNSEGEKK